MDYHIFTTFTIISIGLALSLLKKKDSVKNRKTYIYVVWILLVLESGLRGLSVGDDTLGYYHSFQGTKNTTWLKLFQDFTLYSNEYEYRDTGYDIFQKAFQILSDDYRIYLFFIAILFFTSLMYFLQKNTSTLFELILAFSIYCALFYAFFSITGIKQTITTTVALYCTKYITEKKIWRFAIPIVLISSVHASVLMFLPFYFISNLKNLRLNLALAVLSFPIVMIYSKNIVKLIISGTVYSNYLSDLTGKGTLTFTALILIIVLSSYFFIGNMRREYPNYNIYYNAMILALLFVPLTWVNSNAMRVVQYFSIYMMVFIPKIIEVASNSMVLKRVLYFTCITILIFLIFKTSRPYVFFWDETPMFYIY